MKTALCSVCADSPAKANAGGHLVCRDCLSKALSMERPGESIREAIERLPKSDRAAWLNGEVSR